MSRAAARVQRGRGRWGGRRPWPGTAGGFSGQGWGGQAGWGLLHAVAFVLAVLVIAFEEALKD